MEFKADVFMKLSFALMLVLVFSSCKKDDVVDTTVPGQVTDLMATASDGTVLLAWTEPSDPDLFEIEVAYAPGSGITLSQAAGLNGMTISGLENGTQYDFTVVAVDETGNKSNAVHVTAVPNPPFVVISPNQDNYNPAGGTFTIDGSGHLIITVNFNRPVDPSSVKPALTIYFEGDAISQGHVTYTSQNRTLTFTTTDVLTDFASYSGNVYFDFFLIGDDGGDGVISDENGMVLDGNEDGEAGGDYELNLYIIG